MASISTHFQKLEFASNSVENPRCSNCWEQGSKDEPLFDLHPSSSEHHLACRACTTSWLTNEDLSVKKIFQCHICEKEVIVDEGIIRALVILPAYEEALSEGYVVVAESDLSNHLESPATPSRVASLLGSITILPEMDELESVTSETDSSETSGGAASSSRDPGVVAKPKLSRVSFSPDCEDKTNGKEWRALTNSILDAKPPETFDTLSTSNPEHQEIAILLKNQFVSDLALKHSGSRYNDGNGQLEKDMKSFKHIEGVFFDAINNALEDVVDREMMKEPINHLKLQIFFILEKYFAHDEESTPAFNVNNRELLSICKELIEEILRKPSASYILEEFFLQHLKEKLFQR